MRACLIAPSPTSPVLNAFNFSSAMLFRGSLIFFMPPLTRVALLAHQPQDVGLSSRSLEASPLLLPLADISWGSVGDSHSLWPGVHCSPLPSALRGPEHRSRLVPPTAHIRVGGGFWIFTSGGARAPCPDGGVPPGKSLDSTTTHSAGSGPRGRRPGPPASCARASPSLSPVGGPG